MWSTAVSQDDESAKLSRGLKEWACSPHNSISMVTTLREMAYGRVDLDTKLSSRASYTEVQTHLHADHERVGYDGYHYTYGTKGVWLMQDAKPLK
nr:hypothetical protein CFP56_74956 [Quercus suber]